MKQVYQDHCRHYSLVFPKFYYCSSINKQTSALRQASEESAYFFLSFFCDD